MLLLQVLHENEDYGYSIVVRLQELGFDGLAEGTVYPALTRLESKGFLTSELVPSNAGPARKYYRPTSSGTAELERAARAWASLRINVDRVMSATPATFPSTTEDVSTTSLMQVTR